jgi:hypothetical protein
MDLFTDIETISIVMPELVPAMTKEQQALELGCVDTYRSHRMVAARVTTAR